VSVVVLSPAGAAGLGDCLTSLAAQRPPSGSLEVVLVLFGVRPAGLDGPTEIRRRYPELPLRIVSRPGASRSAARDAGIATARCQYVTILDAGDSVGPAFVRALHEAARPGVVPLIAPEGAGAAIDGEPAERVLDAAEYSAALSFDGGKLIPAAWARSVRVIDPAGRRADVPFWAQLVARWQFSLELCDAGPDAAYHRQHADGREPGFAELVTEPVAAIEGIESTADLASATTARTLDAWASAEAAAIRGYLRANPEQRDLVVAALDDSSVIRVPSRELNKGMATGLVISYCFPPYVDTAAVVAAKRVRQRGEVVDVIYNAMDALRDTEISTRRIADPFISDEAAIRSQTAFSSWASIDSFRALGRTQIEIGTNAKASPIPLRMKAGNRFAK
jgi:hypothetical protein